MDTKPLYIVCALVAIFTLEGLVPHYHYQRNRAKHAFPHVLIAVVNGMLTRFLLAGFTLFVLAQAKEQGLGLMRMMHLPTALRMIIAFVLFDVWMYCWHILNHRIGFFWRFHRTHHADIAMDSTTALRFHPGELVLSTVCRLPALVLIGMNFSELALFETALNISTLFHHSNLSLPKQWDRVLRSVIVTPDMHRVHHSVEPAETNANFTSLLSVWDRITGTFRMREDTRLITLGLPVLREERYQRFWGFLTAPFE